MAKFTYKVTHITTADYGQEFHRQHHLTVVPDGTHWTKRPQALVFDLGDAKVGDTVTVEITRG